MAREKGTWKRYCGVRLIGVSLFIAFLLYILEVSGRQDVKANVFFGAEISAVAPSVKQLLAQQSPKQPGDTKTDEKQVEAEKPRMQIDVASSEISKTFEHAIGVDESVVSHENLGSTDEDAVVHVNSPENMAGVKNPDEAEANSDTGSADRRFEVPLRTTAGNEAFSEISQPGNEAPSTEIASDEAISKSSSGVKSFISQFVAKMKEEQDAAFTDKKPFMLQVGAGTGDIFYEPLKSLLNIPGFHAFFVEANPDAFERLKRNLQRQFGKTDRIEVFNVAICPQAWFGTRRGKKAPRRWSQAMYILNTNFATQYPGKPYGLTFKSRMKMMDSASALGLTKETLSPYIEKVEVECITPEAFFSSKHYLDGTEAKQMRFFEIDGAGLEDNLFVIDSFTHLAGFHPKILFVGGQEFDKEFIASKEFSKEIQHTIGSKKLNYKVQSETLNGHIVAWTVSNAKKSVPGKFEAELVDQVMKIKDHINVLQIGACDGDFNSTSGTSNDPVQRVLGRQNIQAVLIEPNPPMFKTLEKNVHAFFGVTPRVRALNMAICPKESADVPFYVVSPKFAVDYPKAPHWAKYQVSSLNRAQVLKHWETLGIEEKAWEKYVMALQVPCKTPKDLLEFIKFKASDVSILEVDAEGFDGRIVKSFLDMPGFAPNVIIFEIVHLMPREVHELQRLFKELGYHETVSRGNAVMWKGFEMPLPSKEA